MPGHHPVGYLGHPGQARLDPPDKEGVSPIWHLQPFTFKTRAQKSERNSEDEMMQPCPGHLHLLASHASNACPSNVGKLLAKVRNKSSGSGGNLCWGERSPFLMMGVRVRLECGNCRPPTRRRSTNLGCPGFSHIPNLLPNKPTNLPNTLSCQILYPTLFMVTYNSLPNTYLIPYK